MSPAIVGVRERRHLPFFVPGWLNCGELFVRSAFMEEEVVCLVFWKGVVVGSSVVRPVASTSAGAWLHYRRDSMFVGLRAEHIRRLLREPGMQFFYSDTDSWLSGQDDWRELELRRQTVKLLGGRHWGDVFEDPKRLKWKKLWRSFSRAGQTARRLSEHPTEEFVAPDTIHRYRYGKRRPKRNRQWSQMVPLTTGKTLFIAPTDAK